LLKISQALGFFNRFKGFPRTFCAGSAQNLTVRLRRPSCRHELRDSLLRERTWARARPVLAARPHFKPTWGNPVGFFFLSGFATR
jgi:hypothetical protein